MNPADVKAFASRWRMVNDAERAELRATSGERKLEVLELLMSSARALGWATTDAAEVEAVRSRWIKLRTPARG